MAEQGETLYTNPNLDRIIDDTDTTTKVFIQNTNSYRVTDISLHDEESETCEIP